VFIEGCGILLPLAVFILSCAFGGLYSGGIVTEDSWQMRRAFVRTSSLDCERFYPGIFCITFAIRCAVSSGLSISGSRYFVFHELSRNSSH
jgi:hypothetical protein